MEASIAWWKNPLDVPTIVMMQGGHGEDAIVNVEQTQKHEDEEQEVVEEEEKEEERRRRRTRPRFQRLRGVSARRLGAFNRETNGTS